MEEWKIVKSKSGKDEFGFPRGEFLCRNQEEINRIIKENKIYDPVICDYDAEIFYKRREELKENIVLQKEN